MRKGRALELQRSFLLLVENSVEAMPVSAVLCMIRDSPTVIWRL